MSILTIECRTPQELLSWLDTDGERENFWKQWGQPYFRGQSKGNFPLVPTALREDRCVLVDGKWRTARTEREQIAGELELLKRFMLEADSYGHATPGDTLATRDLITTLERKTIPKEKQLSVWPPPELYPPLALAQHHGVPTRMLDWSIDPYVAVFFAAHGAAMLTKRPAPASQPDQTLAVFCCKSESFVGDDILTNFAIQAFQHETESKFLGFTCVILPYHGNPNLRAQRGLFTVLQRDRINLDSQVERLSCEMRLCSSKDRLENGIPRCELFKLTLPNSAAGELLFLLSKKGYTSSRIHPGLDGVAKSVNDSSLWS